MDIRRGPSMHTGMCQKKRLNSKINIIWYNLFDSNATRLTINKIGVSKRIHGTQQTENDGIWLLCNRFKKKLSTLEGNDDVFHKLIFLCADYNKQSMLNLKSQVNLIQNLGGASWRANAVTSRTATMVNVYSIAEYGS